MLRDNTTDIQRTRGYSKKLQIMKIGSINWIL